jgi:hypothetical protein
MIAPTTTIILHLPSTPSTTSSPTTFTNDVHLHFHHHHTPPTTHLHHPQPITAIFIIATLFHASIHPRYVERMFNSSSAAGVRFYFNAEVRISFHH